jgi:hypothetical protein
MVAAANTSHALGLNNSFLTQVHGSSYCSDAGSGFRNASME